MAQNPSWPIARRTTTKRSKINEIAPLFQVHGLGIEVVRLVPTGFASPPGSGLGFGPGRGRCVPAPGPLLPPSESSLRPKRPRRRSPSPGPLLRLALLAAGGEVVLGMEPKSISRLGELVGGVGEVERLVVLPAAIRIR